MLKTMACTKKCHTIFISNLLAQLPWVNAEFSWSIPWFCEFLVLFCFVSSSLVLCVCVAFSSYTSRSPADRTDRSAEYHFMLPVMIANVYVVFIQNWLVVSRPMKNTSQPTNHLVALGKIKMFKTTNRKKDVAKPKNNLKNSCAPIFMQWVFFGVFS